ncbi:unnamed protein product [Closterium sp. NIES-53]
MERPEGFPAPFPPGTVSKLNRPGYGLKQAPREWHNKLKSTLGSLDFHPSTSDPSLFIRATPSRFFILVYVDDMILVTKDPTELAAVKTALGEKLAMKDLGKPTNYPGMEITRDRTARTITLSQKFYINNVLTRFKMQEAASMPTPLSLQHQLTAPSVPSSEPCDEAYPELVGSLMYAMMCTRPDLAYPVSVLSRYVAPGRFTSHHWSAAKRVPRYLKGTQDYVLTLGGSSPVRLEGYSDSSYADDQSDRHSSATALPFPLSFVPRTPPPHVHHPLLPSHPPPCLSLCPTKLTVDLLEECPAAAEKSILAVVGGAATAKARRARVVEGAAVKAVEEAEGVAVEVGVVPGVGASVAAMEVVEAAVEVMEAAAAVVAAAVVLVEVQPRSVEALVVASASSSRTPVRPRRLSSFASGTQGVGGLGNVPIFDLDFDAILAAMYALTDSVEGDCYLSAPPDSGIAAAALGASASATLGTGESVAPGAGESAAPGAGESALSGTAPTEALHTFTLDSGVSRSFFRDSTTLTPLSRPVAVSLDDPSGGPVLAHSSTVLPCHAAPSGLLSGLHLPSFSTNLVSGADLQDVWVDQFAPGGQRVTHCTCSRTGRLLATFTRRPGSSLYTLTTVPPPVSASSQVAASSKVFAAASRSSPASAPCSCRPLSHETLLWHHRLGHPSLPRLRGMASRTLVSGLPRSLPPLPPGPAPTCVPCVEGGQRAAPHSSTFPPTEAPLQTLHMDVWGPARVRGQGHEHYFLLVVDDYSRYTTVFPLRSMGEVTEVLIDWIRGARRQLSESFGSDLPVLRQHSDRGGEFSSDLLRAFCRTEGICQTFMFPASPQQNGIAEHRIGMVMDVARTSMIHVAAPHFLWPFAVQYAAHQINLLTGDHTCSEGDREVDKLSYRAVPSVFLGFPLDAPGWQFYHPTSRRVLSS